MKKILFFCVLIFIGLCGWLICDSLNHHRATGNAPFMLLQQTNALPENGTLAPSSSVAPSAVSVERPVTFQAVGGASQSVVLGSKDEETGVKFEVELTARGAAVSRATFSEHYNRDRKNPQKLIFLSPVRSGKDNIFSFANRMFVLADQKQGLDLGRLNWKCLGKEIDRMTGAESVQYQATIVDDTGGDAF